LFFCFFHFFSWLLSAAAFFSRLFSFHSLWVLFSLLQAFALFSLFCEAFFACGSFQEKARNVTKLKRPAQPTNSSVFLSSFRLLPQPLSLGS
jgi:hypothetical protein